MIIHKIKGRKQKVATRDDINEYKVMWLMVFFDMPTETKQQRKAYSDFRKRLLDDGFTMFQFSIYVRHCASWENAETHRKRVRGFISEYGEVGILTVTDKQFDAIELFHGVKKQTIQPRAIQLELF